MYIEREIDPEIRKHLGKKEFTIVTVARQSVKTSLIKALYKELQNQNRKVSYLTFDKALLS
jgi:predicted AAA+ superfamily ATPase